MKSVSKKKYEKNADEKNSDTKFVATRVRFLKKLGGMSGAFECSSMTAVAARQATPPSKGTNTFHDPHACVDAASNPSTTAMRPHVPTIAPAKSGRSCSRTILLSDTKRGTTASANNA